MGSCYIAQEAPLVLCDHLEGGIGSGKGGKLKREGIYVYSLLVYSVYIAKTIQHCKAIQFSSVTQSCLILSDPMDYSLQLKVIKKNRLLIHIEHSCYDN